MPPRVSATPRMKPLKMAPRMLPMPPKMVTTNALRVGMAPMVGKMANRVP